LLAILLPDVATDVEAAARDLEISDAGIERSWRAIDRLSCAQSVLKAIRASGSGMADVGVADELEAMRDALALLARRWPQDYPAGGVEWLLVESRVGGVAKIHVLGPDAAKSPAANSDSKNRSPPNFRGKQRVKTVLLNRC
jgi:hypothetical protein